MLPLPLVREAEIVQNLPRRLYMLNQQAVSVGMVLATWSAVNDVKL